jgi:hypothetical protein
MKYGGTTRDTDFWIENASLAWDEANAPFHMVGMLTLLRNLQLSSEAGEEVDFDVTGNSSPDSGQHQSRPLSRGSRQRKGANARVRPGWHAHLELAAQPAWELDADRRTTFGKMPVLAPRPTRRSASGFGHPHPADRVEDSGFS